jgi:hypothetical protein
MRHDSHHNASKQNDVQYKDTQYNANKGFTLYDIYVMLEIAIKSFYCVSLF